MDAVSKFHCWGFQTSLLIGDGASANLTMFKTLTGYVGHYGTDQSQSTFKKHYIRPYFISPFTGRKLYIIICPSHMVCFNDCVNKTSACVLDFVAKKYHWTIA